MQHGDDSYGLGSSHYAWSAGMESSVLDPLLVKPHTSWRGHRGIRVMFGGQTEDEADDLLDELEGDFDLTESIEDDEYGALVEAEADELMDELDAELDEDLYGRLYLGAEYHELDHAEPGDLGALVGRSGSSGYRGGRPSFGARVEFGPVRYEGGEVSALFLGFAAFTILGKGMGVF